MLQLYLRHVSSDIVLLTCTLVMACLFIFDVFGLFGRSFSSGRIRHIDFKSSIMSIGIFGTFLGILNGLYGFGTYDVAQSVPRLLEGLKFAFATSVFGMFLSVVLSILQKIFSAAGDDSSILQSIDSRIALLDKTMMKVGSSIESPTELITQFNQLKAFLTRELTQVNTSLDKALHELSRGATQEIIAALEKVIIEFNNNLKEQFGENFKQLNVACYKLVEWQDKYREHVDTAEKHLVLVRKSLDSSADASEKIVKSSAATRDICQQISGLIRTYDVQVRTIEQHLESLKRLGDEARAFLLQTEQALKASTQNMTSFSTNIERSVGAQSESLAQLTEKIETLLPKSLGELENVLTKLTYQFAKDYKSLFEFMVNKNGRK